MPNEIASFETTITLDLASNLAGAQQKFDRLELEASHMAGTNEWPDWYFDGPNYMRDIPTQLREGADYASVLSYFELQKRDIKNSSDISGRPAYIHPLTRVVNNIGESIVGEAIAQEPRTGPLHSALLDVLAEENAQGGAITSKLKVLQKAYGFENLTQLLSLRGDEYADQLRQQIYTTNGIKWIRFDDQKKYVDGSDYIQDTHNWMKKALQVATGVSELEAFNYTFSASKISAYESDEAFLRISAIFDNFGAERIRKITKYTGINGLESYSIGQLENMEALCNNPSQAAEKLDSHDITAVFINRFGDHNGVLKKTAAEFDDGKNSVFFEITNMDDIYRHIVTLNKFGIKPSTLVLASHSAPGQFMVSDKRNSERNKYDVATIAVRKVVEIVNSSQNGPEIVKGFAMHGMKGMARLVEDYMRPSRGIDDDASNSGRKKIIFSACHAAADTNVRDVDENGERYTAGVESVVSQLAKDLVASGLKSQIDIYGGPEGVQMHRTEYGIRYSGQPAGFSEDRTPLHAVRMRIENGAVTKENVEDILLRKAS